MSEQPTLGVILDSEQPRDAVHVAIVAVIADERLVPGSHVGFTRTDSIEHVGVRTLKNLGVVDPFLPMMVEIGQRFYLFLYPQTITSLRHNWTHPAFAGQPESDAKKASEAWLRNFIATASCPDYDTLIAAAVGEHEKNGGDEDGYPGYFNSRNDGEYLHFGGRDAHGDIPPEFWHHVEVVTGRTIPRELRATSFSCSC